MLLHKQTHTLVHTQTHTHAHAVAQPPCMCVAPAGAASEVAISLVFMNDTAYSPTSLGDTGWNKENTIIAVAILDLVA